MDKSILVVTTNDPQLEDPDYTKWITDGCDKARGDKQDGK